MGRFGGSTTSSSTGGVRTFNFEGPDIVTVQARMNGRITFSDGTSVRTWYFGNGFNGDRQWGGPIIECTEGNIAEITLNSGMPHTIHLHGLDVDQANDGVPSTSGYVGRPMGNFGRVDGYTSLGTSYTYTFPVPEAGTYQYHCHVDTVLHYEMSMHGTIIVRPASGSLTTIWDGGPSFDREYVWQLGTVDPTWHNENVSGAGTVRYIPKYFLINGVDGSNLLNDSTVAISASAGQTVLIRVNQTSYQPAVIKLGGLPFDVVASDGRPLPAPLTKTSLYIAPGERYDILLPMPSSGTYYATIDFYDIKGRNVIGTAVTTISVV